MNRPNASSRAYHDGYADAAITIGGTLRCLDIVGDPPLDPSVKPAVGKHVDKTAKYGIDTPYIKEVIRRALETGKQIPLAIRVNGRRRVGYATRISKKCVRIRLFVPKK